MLKIQNWDGIKTLQSLKGREEDILHDTEILQTSMHETLLGSYDGAARWKTGYPTELYTNLWLKGLILDGVFMDPHQRGGSLVLFFCSPDVIYSVPLNAKKKSGFILLRIQSLVHSEDMCEFLPLTKKEYYAAYLYYMYAC